MAVFADESVAKRYSRARELAPATMEQWLQAVRSGLPEATAPSRILDLGAGTGRFTAALADCFECEAIGTDPSEAMIEQARERFPNMDWRIGSAEEIPVISGSVDMIFMSQVFHNLNDRQLAISEMRRCLRPGTHLVVRNASLETNEAIPWLRFFPEALDIERQRIPERRAIVGEICAGGFELVSRSTVEQAFAASPTEYAEKIAMRGISVAVMIPDAAFEAGLSQLRSWARTAADGPVCEPLDLFVFERRNTHPNNSLEESGDRSPEPLRGT